MCAGNEGGSDYAMNSRSRDFWENLLIIIVMLILVAIAVLSVHWVVSQQKQEEDKNAETYIRDPSPLKGWGLFYLSYVISASGLLCNFLASRYTKIQRIR